MNIHLQQCLEEDAASLGLRIINKDVAKIMTVKTVSPQTVMLTLMKLKSSHTWEM